MPIQFFELLYSFNWICFIFAARVCKQDSFLTILCKDYAIPYGGRHLVE